MEFCFYLQKKLVRPKPEQPDRFRRPCYPIVNTNWYPISPHAGVDGDTTPINNSFLPSREASSLCKELGNNYAGPMGSAGNNGVQIRSAPNPLPGKETTCAAPLPNKPCPDNRGSARTASQTGYKGNKSLPTASYPNYSLWKRKGVQRPVINLKALNSLCAQSTSRWKASILYQI